MYLLLLLMLFFNQVKAHYHMTQSGMHSLFKTEEKLFTTFTDIYEERLKVLNAMEQFLNEAENRIQEEADLTAYENYVSHPATSYLILKRFYYKWSKFKSLYSHSEEIKTRSEKLQEILKKLHLEFSDKREIQGAIYAILKVQETYRLDTKNVIQGLNKFSQKMSADDIFTVGHFGTFLSYFALAKTWLEETLNLYLADEKYKAKLPQLYEMLAWCCYQNDELDCAVEYGAKHLELQPDSRAAKNNIYYYRRYLLSDVDEDGEIDPTRKKKNVPKKPWMLRHDTMCRGEEKIPDEVRRTLFCRYYAPSYEFYLKPLKTETLSLEPEILQFHDILLEYEISHIISKAKSMLDISRVYAMHNGQNTEALYRMSKNAWLNPDEDKVTNNLVKRVGAITKLDLRSSELMQVANYGIGGNYEPHYDFASPPINASVFGHYGKLGNRICTFMFYLTDVELGGATVFTQANEGTMALPKKGSAILWYNLKRNGKGDLSTRHAGCPVGLGEKWIANLWIHELGQEFRRPCTLDPKE